MECCSKVRWDTDYEKALTAAFERIYQDLYEEWYGAREARTISDDESQIIRQMLEHIRAVHIVVRTHYDCAVAETPEACLSKALVMLGTLLMRSGEYQQRVFECSFCDTSDCTVGCLCGGCDEERPCCECNFFAGWKEA